MKKIIVIASSIVVLASLLGVAQAKTTHTEKQSATTSKTADQADKQAADTQKSEKQDEDTTLQIGSKTDGVQGRGLPKAFSGSDDSQ